MTDEIETAPQPQGPQVGFLAQYVKDLSFEHPNAPRSLQGSEGEPRIDVNVGVGAQPMAENVYEVELKIRAVARNAELTLFIADLTYAGLFALDGFPAEQLDLFLRIEGPRLLFPFARRILADVTRDGGFPPLLLEPMDFGGLYMQSLQQQQAEAPIQ